VGYRCPSDQCNINQFETDLHKRFKGVQYSIYYRHMRVQVLTTVKMSNVDFWVVALCGNMGSFLITFTAVPWLKLLVAGLSPLRFGFEPSSVYVGFVVDRVALGQVFLRVLRFPLSISFHHGFPFSYIT
jgi:hypothetical protein